MTTKLWKGVLAATACSALLLAGCGSEEADDAGEKTTAPADGKTTTGGGEGGGAFTACSETTPEADGVDEVSLQLQWFTQGQFAGYFAARDQGFYEEYGLDVDIVEGGTEIVPQTQLADGAVDYAIAWVPKALQSIEGGAGITNVSQVFQRSGTLQVSKKAAGITTAADLEGKTVGNWGFGNEFELFAGITKAGLDPAKDVTLVSQQFDMNALLADDIDAAQAMTYNEYAQVLEAENPETGELYTPDDFNVINWNDEGTAMLQDAIWANTDKLTADADYCDQTVRFVAASLKGWAFCRDNLDECVEGVLDSGSELGESHQAWQINETSKLIWPSPEAGAGTMEQDAWDQTVEISLETKNSEGSTVIASEPPASAYTSEVNDKALALLAADDDAPDLVGADFEGTEVTLNPGGE